MMQVVDVVTLVIWWHFWAPVIAIVLGIAALIGYRDWRATREADRFWREVASPSFRQNG